MKLVVAPNSCELPGSNDAFRVILYGQPLQPNQGSVGDAAKLLIQRRRLEPAPRAWDLLSIALSVEIADRAASRDRSPDGWTRELELHIAVADPSFWNEQASELACALRFLTTDRWLLRFHGAGVLPAPATQPLYPTEDCVVLLSGGLDSLVGAIDLASAGRTPFAVSQTVRGDADKQINFAALIGGGLNHLQLNHNANSPGIQESSQRARSLMFITFGVIVATSLKHYHEGNTVPLYVCENGFIAINPPLTGGRIGSLSTRTTHPECLVRLQRVFDAAGLHVDIKNPYAAMTKGEMLLRCTDQTLLRAQAAKTTSCGRFQRHKYQQCGRCVPCQVRRAAFIAWGGVPDTTGYVYEPLGQDDSEHAAFDDVRSVAMALAAVDADGLDAWLGNALGSKMIGDRTALRAMIERALAELKTLHLALGVT